MSVVLLVPLVRCLGARELPIRLAGSCGPSDSAMRFSSPGVLQSSGASNSQQWRQLMPMSCERITVLLAKDVMKPVPPADMKAGFFSPYIIVPKKSGGLQPILGLRILNWAFHKPPFKMLTQNCIFRCIRPRDRSAVVDLKDQYFHVLIFPHHRSVLRFAFEGRVYKYKVLTFGLSLSPCVFTKVAEAALVPLREQGVRILNYFDDWLILAQSQDQLCEHKDLVLSHFSQLVLRVNWEKSKLSPMQRISFLGMELDSVNQTVRLMQERAQSVLNCLNTFKSRTAVPLKQFQRLLGHMAAAAAVTPLGLLHTRPLQHWLHGRVLRWAWQSGTLWVQVTPACRQTFAPWYWSVQTTLRPSRTSTDKVVYALAHSWPRRLRKYAFPPVSLLALTLCKIREEQEQILLMAPYWPTRTWFPELMLLVTAPPWQIPLKKDLLTERWGILWHPRLDLWKLNVWSLDGTRRF